MESQNNKKVFIYSTPVCPYCDMAKRFFSQNNIEYTNYDVSTNIEKRKEMIEKSGQMGVPVIMIDENVIVGFDQNKLEEVFGV
ncbi:MAG: glutaredoxin domain-containing protein [Candidatus Paceibacterota bacterium]